MNINTVILAAGKGTRMRSDLPKVLHKIGSKSMVEHVIDASVNSGCEKISIVYGYGGQEVKATLDNKEINFIEQKEQLGTGHAVVQATKSMMDDEIILILYGDVPLIRTETIARLLKSKSRDGISLLTVNLENPAGYGRIVRDNGKVVRIVEEKDASEKEKEITEVNTGIMAVNGNDLKRWLGMIDNNNAQGEYYLTDIISIAELEGAVIATAHPDDEIEVMGVNDPEQLNQLEQEYIKRIK